MGSTRIAWAQLLGSAAHPQRPANTLIILLNLIMTASWPMPAARLQLLLVCSSYSAAESARDKSA
jgi:hypothetical protein